MKATAYTRTAGEAGELLYTQRLLLDLRFGVLLRVARIGRQFFRAFTAKQPYEKWTIDVTEFSLFEEKLYLSTILDLYNSEIVSYTISPHLRLSMVMNMLNKAMERLLQHHHLSFIPIRAGITT